MRYKLGLENITGKKVTAIVYDINLSEKEAKSKVLITANSIAEKGGSKVLSSTSPYKIVSIESCEPKETKVKVLNGNKHYGALVIGTYFKTFEDKVLGVGGEISAYNGIMRFLEPSWSTPRPGVIVYLINLDNIKNPEVKNPEVKKPEVKKPEVKKPVRKEFTVGDHYLVVSNTLPETDKNEFFCYYDLLCEKGNRMGAPVSQCGTPADVLNVLHSQEKLLEEYISKWEDTPILVDNYNKEKQAYTEFIKILSDPQTYKPIPINR